MSAQTTLTAPPSGSAVEQSPGSSPVSQRGTTTVPARVVARIAEQAAAEVPGIGSAAGGVLGIGARRDFDTRPTVQAEVYGNTAVLRLDVGIGFPTPLGPALSRLREHVRTRVQHLTGLSVGRIDVEVSWLHAATTGGRVLR